MSNKIREVSKEDCVAGTVRYQRWTRQRHEQARVGRGVSRGLSRDIDTRLGAARTRHSIMGPVEMR